MCKKVAWHIGHSFLYRRSCLDAVDQYAMIKKKSLILYPRADGILFCAPEQQSDAL